MPALRTSQPLAVKLFPPLILIHTIAHPPAEQSLLLVHIELPVHQRLHPLVGVPRARLGLQLPELDPPRQLVLLLKYACFDATLNDIDFQLCVFDDLLDLLSLESWAFHVDPHVVLLPLLFELCLLDGHHGGVSFLLGGLGLLEEFLHDGPLFEEILNLPVEKLKPLRILVLEHLDCPLANETGTMQSCVSYVIASAVPASLFFSEACSWVKRLISRESMWQAQLGWMSYRVQALVRDKYTASRRRFLLADP